MAAELQSALETLKYNQCQLYTPYPKQKEFLDAGAKHQFRAAICGNQVGKTLTTSEEVNYHLTGDYPKWWKGHVFTHPTTWYVASVDNKDTRNILQKEYLGTNTLNEEELGTGAIPRDNIGKFTRAQGITGLADIVVWWN